MHLSIAFLRPADVFIIVKSIIFRPGGTMDAAARELSGPNPEKAGNLTFHHLEERALGESTTTLVQKPCRRYIPRIVRTRVLVCAFVVAIFGGGIVSAQQADLH
ncbi:MAG: hypothetical protein H0W34_13075, partial [Pyrinomonadaceae bacterium]|nr:hypothetical protein [Pyrinomonadaceae bacterium]